MIGWREDAREIGGELTRLREELHAAPEVGLQLPRTQEQVLRALDGIPVEVSCGSSTTSVTAVLRGTATTAAGALAARDAPAVLLRADMDAIPVQEKTGLAYSSQVAGVMHACGHDMHTAMLIGAARLLAARRDTLAGDVVLMFQPGEEGWEGARAMIGEGVLDAAGRRVQAALALHVFSTLGGTGGVFTRPGPMLAASARLAVTVRGRGGHGSAPQHARDPITATAEMITALQTMVTRRFPATDPVVLSVGVLRAGTRRNIIPETAYFEATVRSFSPGTAARVGEVATGLLRGLAAGHDVEVDVDFAEERPATVNDMNETRIACDAVTDALGADRLQPLDQPLAASEDFSRVLGLVPGVFLGLGAVPPGADTASLAFNHSPHAVFDSSVLPDGTAVLAQWAQQRLHLLSTRPNCDTRQKEIQP